MESTESRREGRTQTAEENIFNRKSNSLLKSITLLLAVLKWYFLICDSRLGKAISELSRYVAVRFWKVFRRAFLIRPLTRPFPVTTGSKERVVALVSSSQHHLTIDCTLRLYMDLLTMFASYSLATSFPSVHSHWGSIITNIPEFIQRAIITSMIALCLFSLEKKFIDKHNHVT